MTQTAHAFVPDARPTDTVDDRRARMAITATSVQAAHDARLNRAIASVAWERRGLLGRLVKAQ